jgi:hypothetical protein
MKFKVTKDPTAAQYAKGETIIIRKFLLLPRSYGSGTIRWLEFANIKHAVGADMGYSGRYLYSWYPIGFEDS